VPRNNGKESPTCHRDVTVYYASFWR